MKAIPFSGEIVVDADRVDECMEAFDAWFDAFCSPGSCASTGVVVDWYRKDESARCDTSAPTR